MMVLIAPRDEDQPISGRKRLSISTSGVGGDVGHVTSTKVPFPGALSMSSLPCMLLALCSRLLSPNEDFRSASTLNPRPYRPR